MERIKNTNMEMGWIHKGQILSLSSKPSEAIQCFDEALKINSLDIEAWDQKGNRLDMLQRYDESLQCFDEALKIDPSIAGL